MSAREIADCVLQTFERLPAKRKPRQRSDGSKEWVPLSGICLSKDGEPLKCAALGTGMKCLPSSKLHLVKGNVLHDWHAEVLALRGFNRFLVEECSALATAGLQSSAFLRRRNSSEMTAAEYQPFAIKDDVKIHMYCSEAPCGDASMELIMDAQEDATPWPEPPPTIDNETNGGASTTILGLRGRANFSLLGHVRLKPSRPDAPPTLSKSCSDKLALAQTLSPLSSLTSLLITPRNAYLSTLVLPSSQHVAAATERAFSPNGRMSAVTPNMQEQWQIQGSSYAFRPFRIETVDREFVHSRRSIGRDQKPIPSNLSAVYTPFFEETLIGGVLQGRKQFDPRGASKLCRKSMWKAVADVAALVAVPALVELTKAATYADLKKGELLKWRRMIGEDVKGKDGALKNWPSNPGDQTFGLDEHG